MFFPSSCLDTFAKDTADKYLPELNAIKDPIARQERLAELHVAEGVESVARTGNMESNC